MKKTKRVYDPNDNKKPLPRHIYELRKECKLTQAELGEVIKVSKANIASYESGVTIPPTDKIVALAEYFQVSADYLLGLSNAKSNDLTEQAVCDYVGLDVDTVRSLHNSLKDKKTHIAIDFLFREGVLLNKIVKYAWSVIPQILGNTDYKVLFYNDINSIENQEQNDFSGVIFQLQSFHGKFLEYCLSVQDSIETIIFDYVVTNMDTENVIDYLSYLDANAVVLSELFSTYSSERLTKLSPSLSFKYALEWNDVKKYERMIRPPMFYHARPNYRERKPLTEEEKDLFKITASRVLREKAKRRPVKEKRAITQASCDIETSDKALKE